VVEVGLETGGRITKQLINAMLIAALQRIFLAMLWAVESFLTKFRELALLR
jgi:hypothetical protein